MSIVYSDSVWPRPDPIEPIEHVALGLDIPVLNPLLMRLILIVPLLHRPVVQARRSIEPIASIARPLMKQDSGRHSFTKQLVLSDMLCYFWEAGRTAFFGLQFADDGLHDVEVLSRDRETLPVSVVVLSDEVVDVGRVGRRLLA